jgi:ferritin-like metal-binding protein YciE
VLPELHKSVKSKGLAEAVAEHLEQTKAHGPRLEQVFRAVGAEPSSIRDPAVEKLAEHHVELSGSFADDRLADVFHAAAAARTEHDEIAMYDTLLVLGNALDLGGARGLLEENRKEEEQALDRVLSELERLVRELHELRES